MAGLTDTGFEPETRADLLSKIEAYERAKISDRLDLSEANPLGNVNAIVADDHEQLWQLLEEAYLAYDLTGATDDRVVALGVLMGVPRRGATKGLVRVTLNLDAAQTFAPGDIELSVADDPENVWQNRKAVVSSSSGVYEAVFESQVAGASAIAPAGTLTVIVTGAPGVNSATNAADAEPGLDLEPIDRLRVRIAQSVARGGQRTTNAIRAAIVALDGVLECNVFENTSTATVDGIPAHSMRVVVWDGTNAAADDDEVAQAIWDRSATFSVGSQSGEAQDETLGVVTVAFDRAAASAVTIAVVIESASRVAAADVRAAILAAFPLGGVGRVGADVIRNRLAGAVFDVAGVDDWTSFTVNGGTADLEGDPLTVYQLADGDISVTGDVT